MARKALFLKLILDVSEVAGSEADALTCSTSGWNSCVPPNRPLFPWPNVLKDPLVEGWVRSRDDPDVAALRERLQLLNCLPDLEILSPRDSDYVSRAALGFERHGFVVVRDALDAEQLRRMRNVTDWMLSKILEEDPGGGAGGAFGRLPHRYSYGDCSGTRQNLHLREYLELIDLPAITPVLQAIFGADDYVLGGCGGDVVLPGAVEYQHLHLDSIWGRADDIQDLPVPVVTVNFAMQDLTALNGPIRHIPGSHHSHESVPDLLDEPDWMKLSTLCPVPAGSAIFRDNRAWHGGTPNLSEERRSLPNVEFFAAWIKDLVRFPGYFNRTPPYVGIPEELLEDLSSYARRVARDVIWHSPMRIPNEGLYSPWPKYHEMR